MRDQKGSEGYKQTVKKKYVIENIERKRNRGTKHLTSTSRILTVDYRIADTPIIRTHSNFQSYINSSSGVNLTPYSGVVFWGVILTPKRSLKNSFSEVKITPDIEELK